MADDVRTVQLKRSDSFGFGFSVFGGSGSGFPPVVYDVIENSPAAVSGQLEAGDVILEVNDKTVVSLTTKEDSIIRDKVRGHMAASNKLEALRKKSSESRVPSSNNTSKTGTPVPESNGVTENDENIPPQSTKDNSNNVPQNESNKDNFKSSKSQTRVQQPRCETFMMTGDLIIKLNAKTSNLGTKRIDNLPFGQTSTPTSPEEIEQRLHNKAVKRESSNHHSPVAEKKGSYNYNASYVRTSKSEDHLQKASLTTVNIDIEDDIASSLNTLLDTNQDNPANERIVWTYNAPVVSDNKSPSPPSSTSPTSPRSLSSSSSIAEFSSKPSSPRRKFFSGEQQIIIPSNFQEGDHHINGLAFESPMERISSGENHIGIDQCKMGNKHSVANHEQVTNNHDNVNKMSSRVQQKQNLVNTQLKEDGVTNIIIDENKIYVQVSPSNCVDDLASKDVKKEKNSSQPVWLRRGDSEGPREHNDSSTNDEDSNHSTSPPMDDESDIESLHSFHYSPKAIDMPSASRLAKRLFYLEGFKKSDVSRHLCKNNDFSRVVAEEYLKFFDFSKDTLDAALRKFLKQFCLIGETQERERVLVHYSKRYLECNPGAFKSQDAVHTLTCALMLLNTDLHGENVGRKMTCMEFIENLAELNDGENFPKEVLKSLYHSIKSESLEWATEEEDDIPPPPEGQLTNPENRQAFIGHNPFLEVPNPNCATEYKKGYVMRKCCIDPNGKRTPLGKRGWKMFYATLRDLVLYLHKDENGFRKNQLFDSLHNSIRIHHALATKAADYTKKQHVFRLQTSDQAEYLFQTSDSKELQGWIDTLNFVAANLSSPPLACGVGSQKKFQRPLLPVSHTKLNFVSLRPLIKSDDLMYHLHQVMKGIVYDSKSLYHVFMREQLQDQEDNIARLEKELEEHLSHTPERGAKSRHIHEFMEKEAYLQFELKRYRTYAFLLRSKLAQFPELEPPLVETSIGEVEEPIEKSDIQLSNNYDHLPSVQPDSTNEVKRSLSDRFSYRAAIYKGGGGEGCV